MWQYCVAAVAMALAALNETMFQDRCSYAHTLLLATFYVRCFIFRNVAMATAATQYCHICDHDNESKLTVAYIVSFSAANLLDSETLTVTIVICYSLASSRYKLISNWIRDAYF
jgi:hypothetical protein